MEWKKKIKQAEIVIFYLNLWIEELNKLKNYKSYESYFKMCKDFIKTYNWDEYECKIEDKTPNTKQLPYCIFVHLHSAWFSLPLEDHYEDDEILEIAHYLKVHEKTLEAIKDKLDPDSEYAEIFNSLYSES